MYHVIGTGLIAILLYLISYIYYRLGFFSVLFHRKLWNSLLAVAFIVTALAGIFMALQNNYKWDLPFVKSIVRWHAEFGIGMAFTGIFHFIWHLSYFGKIFKKQEDIEKRTVSAKMDPDDISLNLFIVGFTSTSVQLLLIREMMNIAGGYELITGIFLGSWLITSALGATLAGRSELNDVKKINLIFSISPVISVLLLFMLSRLFLTRGETPSFLVSIVYTLIVLIPFCLVSGFIFVRLLYIARSGNNFVPGKSYSIETAGAVAAGIIISVLTSGLMNTYQILLLVILGSVAYVVLAFFISGARQKLILKLAFTLLAILIIIGKPDNLFRQILFPGINIFTTQDTPYGNITEGLYEGEKSIYYNQRLLVYNDDVIEREENVHYAMLQSKTPETVILVSGSLLSHIPEIMKYPVRKIIYIERDPALAKTFVTTVDSLPVNLVVENKDAFRYIRSSGEMADVILMLVPPPTTLLLNRYYTTEFFMAAKAWLKESRYLYSSVFKSLKQVFKNVKPVLGNKLYFIASDSELSLSFCQLTETRKISNTYVCPDYLADDLVLMKSDEVTAQMDPSVKENRSEFPVGFFYFQAYNFSKSLNEKIPAIVLVVIIFAVPVLGIKKKNLLMYFSATAMAGFEIIILLTLQLVVGNMYQLTGLIIAGLMTGLALGAGIDAKILDSYSFRIKGFILLLFYIVFGLLYDPILELKSEILAIVIIVTAGFIPAFLTGHLFRSFTLDG
jgi:predicted membrane-bound spermidine synthase